MAQSAEETLDRSDHVDPGEILAIAAKGDHVLVERIDQCKPADGSASTDVEVNGSFRLRDGQIVYWYDYFDPRPFLKGSSD